ncbi:MAG: hypothetical protein KZQ94_10410 [Candidatus Thiodiazotropha sp. (ex Troendleina suluensis)]|nr:hypothetical protein [Candidatus Thiodiazotropha sp. (ex Troendleina suluensis)]
MTDFTATQSGDAKDGATYGLTSPGTEGTHYPDFTNGGDTLSTSTFALTNIAGILGDDTAMPPLSVAGTADLSGRLELRPGAEAVALNDGTLNQGGHEVDVEPNDNAATLFSITGTGTSTWNTGAGAEIHHDGTRNSGGTCEGLVMPDAYNPAYNLALNWAEAKYYGFGNGTSTYGMFYNGWAGDSFLWDGGKYTDCGQMRINLAPQGFPQQTTFRLDSVAIGAWRGTFGASGSTDHPIRLNGLIASPAIEPRITNCLIFNNDPADNYQLLTEYSGSGEINLSGTTFLNYGLSAGYLDTNIDDCWFAITTEGDDVTIGIGRDATSTQSFDRVSVTGNAANAHLISISGDANSTTYPIDDIIIDGCGYTYPGDRGDMPIIYSQTVTLNNPLQVQSGGGINPSLGSTGTINVNRGTFHQAVNVLCGEGAAAASNTTLVGDFKNCIISRPYGDAMFTDGGGFMATQTAADINYNAFIEAEMDANNLAHGTLTGNGYFDNDMTGHLTDGPNDIHVTNFEFADETRNGYTWANSHGYASTEQGFENAILAFFGVTIAGADQTADPDTNHSNYRAYIEAGYMSSNTSLQGAGEGGVDIGAFDILASVNKSVADAGSGVDVLGMAVGVITNDSGVGADASDMAAGLVASDTGSGIDVSPASAAHIIADAASAIDSVSNLSAVITITDAAASVDGVSQASINTASDSAIGSDDTALTVLLITNELGVGVDVGTVITQLTKFVADSGGGSDIATVNINVSASDSGSVTDAAAISVNLSVQEIGSGLDSVSALTEILKTVIDSGAGVDQTITSASLDASDNGTGADQLTLAVNLAVSDVGTGSELLSKLEQFLLSVSDAGTSTESIALDVNVSAQDMGLGVDQTDHLAILTTLETAGASDVVVRYVPGSTVIASISFSLNAHGASMVLGSRSTDIKLN